MENPYATGRNGVFGFAGFRTDAPQLAVGCFTRKELAFLAVIGWQVALTNGFALSVTQEQLQEIRHFFIGIKSLG
jgi:hypothetical protein